MASAAAPAASIVPMAHFNPGETKLSAGLNFVIDKTWDGEPIDHEPFKLHLEWFFQRVRGKPHKRVVKVVVEGQ